MNVSFTAKQADYIASQVASGDYQNASEVVREALRLHEAYRSRMIDELRMEISKGWDAPIAGRSVKDIIASKIKS
jgi:antitoxin ParD1/3/4